jgi:hypothetical protein
MGCQLDPENEKLGQPSLTLKPKIFGLEKEIKYDKCLLFYWLFIAWI